MAHFGRAFLPRSHPAASPPRHLPRRRGLDHGHRRLHSQRQLKPFVWTVKAADILEKVKRARATLGLICSPHGFMISSLRIREQYNHPFLRDHPRDSLLGLSDKCQGARRLYPFAFPYCQATCYDAHSPIQSPMRNVFRSCCRSRSVRISAVSSTGILR
jgi:hypothetical protein